MTTDLGPASVTGLEAGSGQLSLLADEDLKLLLLIRHFELKLLTLFEQGALNGTTHTCIGQEYVPVALRTLVTSRDFVFSNHRGHGHYLARYQDPHGLLAEIMGREGAICRGTGGSQHILRDAYLSTGVQGQSMPVAAGMALHLQRTEPGALACVYIGDGTWGEGAVYEALNLAALWRLPLLALKRPVVSQVLEVLTAAGVVESGRLRHPEIVAILLDSLTSEDAARLHTRAAEMLSEHGVEAVEVARHLIAADSAPGSWAVRLLRHAANLSVVEDVGLAVSCLELAIRGSDEERDLVDLRAGLVQIAWRVNPSAAARQLNLLHGALRAGELVWRDAVPMIRHLFWQGDLAAAVQHLRAVNASAGPADVRTTSKLRLACEWIYGPLRDRVPEDIRTLLTSTDRTKSSLNPWTRTANLNSAWTRGAHSEVVRSAEHILQSCLGDVMPEVAVSAILALDHADQHERTRFWCDMLADKAVDEGAITWQAVLGCARADIDWRRGDLMTAEAQASTALGLLQTQSWGVLIGLPLSILILVNTAAGRYEAAAELLARAVPEAMFSTVFGARYLHASGHYSLATGRTLAALDAFERCGAWMKDWALDVPEPVSWRGDIAQAYLKLGLRKDARELVLEQLNRPGAAIGLRTRGISLRVLAACSDPKDRIPVLGEAIELLERCGDQLELARGLADLSHTHRELGQLDCARLMLRRADQVAKTYHTEVPRQLHGSLDRQVREQGARDIHTNGTAALSDAERKVVELAAHGHTNREIGRKLYITVSTVEQHLTRVYKKLNVTKRTDLPMSDS